MYLHTNITFLREQKGITNRHMAADMKISPSVAHAIEFKDTKGTRLLTAMKIAEYFKVSLDDLVYKDLAANMEENNCET